MRELERLLPELTPPPGGLARLQHSLHAQRQPARWHGRAWLPIAAGAGALALLTLAWLPRLVVHQRQTDALTRILLQAAAPPALANGIRVDHGAALPLPSGQADVRIYLIATTPAATH